jgi:hypothetical protein
MDEEERKRRDFEVANQRIEEERRRREQLRLAELERNRQGLSNQRNEPVNERPPNAGGGSPPLSEEEAEKKKHYEEQMRRMKEIAEARKAALGQGQAQPPPQDPGARPRVSLLDRETQRRERDEWIRHERERILQRQRQNVGLSEEERQKIREERQRQMQYHSGLGNQGGQQPREVVKPPAVQVEGNEDQQKRLAQVNEMHNREWERQMEERKRQEGERRT